MNAAARLVHEKALSLPLSITLKLKFKEVLFAILVLSIIFSGLSIIYFTYYQRLLYSNYQQLLQERNKLQIIEAQLLLEQSAWTVQSRIADIAEKKLDMVMPDQKTLVIVRE